MDFMFFLLLAAVPLFVFVSSIAVWVKSNNIREEIDQLRREVSELRVSLANLSLRPPQHPKDKASAWDRARDEAQAYRPAASNRPAEIHEDLSPTEASIKTAGGIPPASPLPPATPIPAATPTTPPPEATQGRPYTMPNDVRAAYEREKTRLMQEEELRRQAAALDAPAEEAPDAKPPGSFEFQFGKRLPVWIGGIALALSGFYLVKYSIEQGWLTEQIRCILGFLLGCALTYGAHHIQSKKPDMADGVRIAQSLAGAGVAVFYATFYAMTMMYHLVPPIAGLVLMAATTFFAVVLSVRHGMPIAVLGMIGGFLTPALIRTDHPSAPHLFAYLFLLVAGLFYTFRKRGWWVLSVPVVMLAFSWVLLWVFSGHFVPSEDGIYMCLFILGICGVIFAPDLRRSEEEIASSGSPADTHWIQTLHWATAGAALTLMAFVTASCNYDTTEWGFFGILALGGMAMAFFRESQFRYLPMATLALNMFMIVSWQHPVDMTYAGVQIWFAAVYILPSLFMLRLKPSMTYAGLLATAVLGCYGIGYLTIRANVYPLMGMVAPDPLHFWSALAIIIALSFGSLTATVFTRFQGDPKLRDNMLALFSLITTAFISTALTIEVHHDFLPVAFAAETMAVCWVAAKIDIKTLRTIAGILFGAFLFLIAPQLLLLCNLTVNSLFGVTLSDSMPELAKHPVFQLGVPMVMLGLGAWLLRLRGDSRLVELFEMAMVGLGALMLYYLARHAFKVPDDVVFRKAGFMERGVITNIFFAAALGVVWAGRNWSRRALLWSGSLLFGMALFRICYFDLFLANPIWSSSQDVGAAPIINWLLLPYALPVFWIWLEERPALRVATIPNALRGGFALFLMFVFISLEVRQYFHGGHLTDGVTENAEVYTYSAVWLVLGALLLFLGTLKKNRPIRVASLVLMILTVGKVFLYDIDALTGLYRVFSFMGLGLSLLALSWFYSRFVFKDK